MVSICELRLHLHGRKEVQFFRVFADYYDDYFGDREMSKEMKFSPVKSTYVVTKVEATMKAVKDYLGEEEGLKLIRRLTYATFESANTTNKRNSKCEEILRRINISTLKKVLNEPALDMETPQLDCTCIELIRQTDKLMHHYHTVVLVVYIALYKTFQKLTTLNTVEKSSLLKTLEWSNSIFNKYKRRCKRVDDLVNKLGFGSFALSTVMSVTELEEIPNASWNEFIQQIKSNEELTALFSNYHLEGYILKHIA